MCMYLHMCIYRHIHIDIHAIYNNNTKDIYKHICINLILTKGDFSLRYYSFLKK